MESMKKIPVRIAQRKILADIITPVSIYLKVRDIYPNSLLLESSDYHSKENSFSFICMDPVAEFLVHHNQVQISLPGQEPQVEQLGPELGVVEHLDRFKDAFEITNQLEGMMVDGVFGYATFDAVQYFEDIRFRASMPEKEDIP